MCRVIQKQIISKRESTERICRTKISIILTFVSSAATIDYDSLVLRSSYNWASTSRDLGVKRSKFSRQKPGSCDGHPTVDPESVPIDDVSSQNGRAIVCRRDPLTL